MEGDIQVKYALVAGTHRPYLKLNLLHISDDALHVGPFGLLDSGADNIVVSYSDGKALGFANPTEKEIAEKKEMTGLGGKSWLLERECRIQIVDLEAKRIYEFKERVAWLHPFPVEVERRNRLLKEYKQLAFDHDAPPDKVQAVGSEIARIGESYEMSSALLGRPFFHNFKRICFHHASKKDESKCWFHYKIDLTKIERTLPL